MMKRLIIFLIRKRLGLKKYQEFKFTNQKSDVTYYFKSNVLMKHYVKELKAMPSDVSLNWLLDDDCKIEVKVK